MLSEKETEFLLSDIFPKTNIKMIKSPPNDIKDFTNAMFVEEGLDPLFVEKNLYRSIYNYIDNALQRATSK